MKAKLFSISLIVVMLVIAVVPVVGAAGGGTRQIPSGGTTSIKVPVLPAAVVLPTAGISARVSKKMKEVTEQAVLTGPARIQMETQYISQTTS